MVGQNLSDNNSANLCHLAYLKGLKECGTDITVLSATGSLEGEEDKEKYLNIKRFNYKSDRFYHRFYRKTVANAASENSMNKNFSSKQKIKAWIKKIVKKLSVFRSVYGTNIVWYKNAKRYKSKEEYDCIISLSWPTVSHKLASYLIKKKKVIAKKFIQIWEDPWGKDLYICKNKQNERIIKEERKLLKTADEIVYVTPITLYNQQATFKESANKMRWEPLPSYYEDKSEINYSKNVPQFGYFGEYYPHVRNIAPFIEAVKELNVPCNVCGNPYSLFQSGKTVKFFPRMSLHDLKQIEHDTEVLVFVANLGGGQIPGKIYQYSATKKYILFILDGSEKEKNILKEYFGQFNRYIFCENEKESIILGIKEILRLYTEGKRMDIVGDFMPKEVSRRIIGSEQ